MNPGRKQGRENRSYKLKSKSTGRTLTAVGGRYRGHFDLVDEGGSKVEAFEIDNPDANDTARMAGKAVVVQVHHHGISWDDPSWEDRKEWLGQEVALTASRLLNDNFEVQTEDAPS